MQLQRVQPYCSTFQCDNVTTSMPTIQHVRELKGEKEIGATFFFWTTRQLAQ